MTEPRPSLWRATRADALDWFDADAVRRSRDYSRPIKRARRITDLIALAALVAALATHAIPKLLDAFGDPAWPLQILIATAVLLVAGQLIDLPLSAWLSLRHDKTWELSTQTTRGFVTDAAKEIVLSVVIASALLIGVYWVIRETTDWWIFGGLLFMAIAIIAVFVVPVVIMPIFNKFTPLPEGELKDRIDRVASLAGVTIRGSFTMDASRRSRRDNAFVAGFGPTKRVVIFDTMLDHPPVTIEHVVAHEIGHYRLHHIVGSLAAAVVTTAATFGAMQALLSWHGLLHFAGVNRLENPGSLPLLIAVFGVLQMAAGLLTATLSRHNEREADLEALLLLKNPEAMIDVWRRMAPKNLTDLEPSLLKRLTASHPSMPERMAFARDWGRLNQVPSASGITR